MIERLLEDYLFDAPEVAPETRVIDGDFVKEELSQLIRDAHKNQTLV